ncbi:LppU/SCO3897 family protein, partial [Planomonospora algeriensis]
GCARRRLPGAARRGAALLGAGLVRQGAGGGRREGELSGRRARRARVGGRAVACLGEGGGVLSVGDCVVRPAERLVSRRALTRTPCGSPEAWARVTARAGSNEGCPAGSDRYLRVRGPGIPRPVTCLRRVALHGSP